MVIQMFNISLAKMPSRALLIKIASSMRARNFNTGVVSHILENKIVAEKSGESERMKKFHDKLKSESNYSAGTHVDGIILVDTDSKRNGTAAVDADPTKWGDWQNGGRVTDF